jgi:hypothetical protein
VKYDSRRAETRSEARLGTRELVITAASSGADQTSRHTCGKSIDGA